MKTFSNPKFSKVCSIKNLFLFFFKLFFFQSLAQDRQLAAEIHLPGGGGGSELNITQEQYRLIMREAIGCI